MTRPLPRRLGAAGVLIGLVLTTAACSGDDESAGASGSTATPSAATSSSAAPAPTATGPSIGIDLLTLRGLTPLAADLPWQIDKGATETFASLPGQAADVSLELAVTSAAARGDFAAETRDAIDAAAERGLERSPDATVGGEPAYLFTGAEDGGSFTYAYGGVHAGQLWNIEFAFIGDFPDRDRVVAAMMATFAFTG